MPIILLFGMFEAQVNGHLHITDAADGCRPKPIPHQIVSNTLKLIAFVIMHKLPGNPPTVKPAAAASCL